jgi:hypothetical protein
MRPIPQSTPLRTAPNPRTAAACPARVRPPPRCPPPSHRGCAGSPAVAAGHDDFEEPRMRGTWQEELDLLYEKGLIRKGDIDAALIDEIESE